MDRGLRACTHAGAGIIPALRHSRDPHPAGRVRRRSIETVRHRPALAALLASLLVAGPPGGGRALADEPPVAMPGAGDSTSSAPPREVARPRFGDSTWSAPPRDAG